MSPRQELAWKSVRLDVHVEGTAAAPRGTGRLRVEGVDAFGVALKDVSADLALQDGRVRLEAVLEGIRTEQLATFAAAPVRIAVEGPITGPIDFSLMHTLMELRGTARQDGSADIALTLPDLAPLAAIGAVAVSGTAATKATLRWKDGALAWMPPERSD
jgi:translocation and assembly module TamB